MFFSVLELITLTAKPISLAFETSHRRRRWVSQSVVTCIVAVVCLLTATAGQAKAIKCYQQTLPNGVNVVVCPDPTLTLTCVDVWIRAGTVFEETNERGAAHFIEHMLFRGTNTRGPGDMDLEIESVGATLNASTSRDWAHFHTTIATQYIDTALDILSDALQNPVFSADEFEIESRVILTEIAGRRVDPIQRLEDELSELLYGDHPYAHPVYGKNEDIALLSPESLRRFFRKHYIGPNMTVVIVGNVDVESAQQKAASYFNSIPSGDPASWPDPASALTETKSKDLPRGPAGTEWMATGFIGPSMSTPEDVWAMDVLITALVRPASGILYDLLVNEHQTALAVDVGFLTQRLPAKVSFALASVPGKLEENSRLIAQELNRVAREGITHQELARAKRTLLGQYAFEVETASGQSGSVGFYSKLSSVQDSVNYPANIFAVTAEDVRRVAGRYLDPAKSATVRLSE